METLSILDETNECVDLFKGFYDIFDPLEYSDGVQIRFVIGEQTARFKIWAGTFGVFAKQHGSLDYRLRDNLVIRQAILGQLSKCQEALKRMIRLARKEDHFSTTTDLPDVFSELGVNSSVTTSSTLPSVDDSSTHSVAYYGTNPSLAEELRSIEETTDRLYRISTIIRARSFTSHAPRAETFILEAEDGTDIGQAFKAFASELIRLRCPEISKPMLDRLSDAVLLRRKRFEFVKRHQSKLDPFGLVKSTSRTHHAAPMTASPRTTIQLQSPNVASGPYRTRKNDAELLSSTTVSQKPNILRLNDILSPRTVASTAIRDPSLWAATLSVPLPPKVPTLAKEFQCPYCFMILPADDTNPRKWINHVVKDTEPYICIVENCTSGHTIFPDEASWLSHLGDHATTWACDFPGHQPLTFTSGLEYESHIERDHSKGDNAPSKVQIPIFRQLAERRADLNLDACPFCDAQVSELPKNTRTDPMLDHVQIHLRNVALISLPWRDDVDGVHDVSTAGTTSQQPAASETQNDLSSLSKEFQDSGSGSRPGDDENHIMHERGTSTEGAGLDEEWGFIQFPVYYSGHELDPILQRFMKELYLGLEASPLSHAPRGPALPCYLLPPIGDRGGCLGRQPVIEKLERILCPSPQSGLSTTSLSDLKVFAICGPGGMGKTSIAFEFVQRYQNRFDAVLWVRGDSRIKLLQEFRRVAVKLALVAKDSVDSKDQMLTRDLVKRFLINPKKGDRKEGKVSPELASWLLVFDGVENADLLKNFWPYGGPGSILITSRDPLPYPNVHELVPLDDSGSARLLLHLTERDRNAEDRRLASEVAKRVGGFPLALTHLASIINQRQWSFSKFINAFEKRESKGSSPLDETHDIYKYQLASTWGLENLKYGKTLLDILSMLDPDGISEPLLMAHVGRSSVEGYPRSVNEFKRAKIELLQSSLVYENRGANNICLHRLVTDVCRTRMSPARYRSTFLECTRIVSAAWPYEDFTWRHGVERWAECEKLFPHILQLLELAGPIQVADDLEGPYEFARLLTDASWYHHERGGSDESVKYSLLAKTILDSLQARLTETRAGVTDNLYRKVRFTLAEILHNRGCFATETNQPEEALFYHTAFNDLMVSEFPNEYPHMDIRLAISWNELGTALMMNNDSAAGEKCFSKSMAAIKALDTFDSLQLSLPIVNLGLAYWLRGMSTEAAKILLDGLSEREAAFGKEDQDSFVTGRFLHALGNVKHTQGYHNESFEYHRRALLHYKSTLGNNHHRTADLCVRVAFHHMRMRHFDLSLALINQALKIYGERRIFSCERLRARFNRGKIYRTQGKTKEANEDRDWCVQRYLQITGLTDGEPDDGKINRLVVFWSR